MSNRLKLRLDYKKIEKLVFDKVGIQKHATNKNTVKIY